MDIYYFPSKTGKGIISVFQWNFFFDIPVMCYLFPQYLWSTYVDCIDIRLEGRYSFIFETSKSELRCYKVNFIMNFKYRMGYLHYWNYELVQLLVTEYKSGSILWLSPSIGNINNNNWRGIKKKTYQLPWRSG